MSSLATIGNATLIAYDNNLPILSTDPWFGDEDSAYFGSWTLSHEIPANYKKDIITINHIENKYRFLLILEFLLMWKCIPLGARLR